MRVSPSALVSAAVLAAVALVASPIGARAQGVFDPSLRRGLDGAQLVSEAAASAQVPAHVPGVLLVQFEEGVLEASVLEGVVADVPVERVVRRGALARALAARGATRVDRVVRALRPSVARSLTAADGEWADGDASALGGLSRLMRVAFAPDVDVVAVRDAVGRLAGVEVAELDALLAPQAIPVWSPWAESPNELFVGWGAPSDPDYVRQRALANPTGVDIDAEAAWAVTTGTYLWPGKVGVIDSGIDYHHPDLGAGAYGYEGAKVRGGYDWVGRDGNPDDEYDDPDTGVKSHGTIVAGIIGAYRNNGVGIAGIAGGDGGANRGAQLFALKVSGSRGGYSLSAIIDALVEGSASGPDYGYGAKVLNASFGLREYSESLRQAVNAVARNGAVLVAARGNVAGTEAQTTAAYPAAFDAPWVVSVGASTSEDDVYGSSYYGRSMDVIAPGTPALVWSTYRVENGSYGWVNGTSVAAPHVTGVASLLYAVRSDLHAEEVDAIVRASADKVPAMGGAPYTERHGAGRLNAARAVALLRAPNDLARYSTTGGASVSVSGPYSMAFMSGGPLAQGVYSVRRHQVEKTVTFAKSYTSAPHVWCRGTNASTGWSAASPNYQTGYCEVVSSTSTSAVLRTYVYEVTSLATGASLGTFPASPSAVRMAYTVVGPVPPPAPLSASVSGPGVLAWKQQGTYTASAAGGSGSTSYQWYRRAAGASAWETVAGATASTYVFQMTYTGGAELRVRVVRGSETAYATRSVAYCASSPCLGDEVRGDAPSASLEREAPALTVGEVRPNPARASVAVDVASADGRAEVTVHDVTGREVLRVVGEEAVGAVRWDVSGWAAGVYVVRVASGAEVAVRRLTVVR